MDVTSQQLNDLVNAYGQREAARRLGKPQRQVWGWLKGEHDIRRSNRAEIQRAWDASRAEPAPPNSPLAVIRHLRALPGRRPTDARRIDVDEDEHATVGGAFVLLEDYGARHLAGALARGRPQHQAR